MSVGNTELRQKFRGQLRCMGQGRDSAERLRWTRWTSVDRWLREYPGSGIAKADRRRSPEVKRGACVLGTVQGSESSVSLYVGLRAQW